MEKINYISLYLPYKIMGKYRLGDVISNASNPNEIRVKYLTPLSVDFFIKFCKPVLKPLSTLTREEYWKLSSKDKKNDFEGYSSKNYSKNDYKLIPFNKMKFLLKHKFDIFGLIDKGLAISY